MFRFNTTPRLNDLLMKLNMKMGLFKSGQTVNVDFDHVFVKTEKADAKYSYKQAYGYFPGVVSIDGIIAYIENRDGNTPVKFHQADTLSRAFKLLHSYGLHIGTRRMKLLDSNEIRQLRDVCIFEVNGMEVYM